MSKNARVGDIGVGVCPCHEPPLAYTTVFSETGAATSVKTNGQSQVIIGTIGIASCGHPTTAETGSGTVNAEGSGVHRLGDTGSNCGGYTVTTSSDDVDSGG